MCFGSVLCVGSLQVEKHQCVLKAKSCLSAEFSFRSSTGHLCVDILRCLQSSPMATAASSPPLHILGTKSLFLDAHPFNLMIQTWLMLVKLAF